MDYVDVKIDNAEEVLKNVLSVLEKHWQNCQQGFREDGSVHAHGNSYICFEAGGFFAKVMEDVQSLMPEEIVFDLTIPDYEDPEDRGSLFPDLPTYQ